MSRITQLVSFLYFFLLKRIWRGPASPWFFWWVWRERREQMQIKRILNSELPKTYRNSGVHKTWRWRKVLCKFRRCAVGSVWISVTKRVPLSVSLRCLLSVSLRCLLSMSLCYPLSVGWWKQKYLSIYLNLFCKR